MTCLHSYLRWIHSSKHVSYMQFTAQGQREIISCDPQHDYLKKKKKLFRDDRDCVCLDVCFIHSGKWAKQQGNRRLINWFLCVVNCRPADRPQRGGRGQPGGDSWICQSIQDPPAIPGPDTDSGGPGAQCRRGAGVQPVCHLQVRTNTEGESLNNKGFIISDQYDLILSNESSSLTELSGAHNRHLFFIPCFRRHY